MDHVLRELGDSEDVLDLGVGTGRELPALLDAGLRVTGLDASKNMLAECGKRSRKIPIFLGDFYSPWPFAEATFDAIPTGTDHILRNAVIVL